jgi:hypothetical protein
MLMRDFDVENRAELLLERLEGYIVFSLNKINRANGQKRLQKVNK